MSDSKPETGGNHSVAPPSKSTAHRSSQTAPTKKAIGLKLLKRPKGATVAELQKALGWQAHSVRGFLAGTVKALPGITLVCEQSENGPRVYRVLPTEEPNP